MENSKRIIHSDEKLSISQSLFYGFQSVLACNFFLGPIVLIGAFQLDVKDAAALIAFTFLACGLATIVQSGFFLKFQVIQGMSFATLGAIISIGMKTDFATLFGALMIGSGVLIVIGVTKIFSKIVSRLIPGLVAGTVIICIGLALMPITWNSLIAIPGNPGINFLEAGVTFAAMLIFMRLGSFQSSLGRILSIGSVIYAIVLGTIVASLFGHVDLSPVGTAPWFSIPKLFPYGPPKFDLNASLVMTFILLIVLVESIGTWFTYTALSGETMDNQRIDRGVIGEGLGCLIGTLFGGMPVTSYGSNSGVLAVTKVFSRYAALGAGVIAIAMALCPKLMYLIAVIPSSVIWGIYAVICVAVVMSGLASIRVYPFSERNNLVVGVSILTTIGASLLPPQLVNSLPSLISYVLGSAIIVGALTAIILNLIIPEKEEDGISLGQIEANPAAVATK